MASRKPNLRRLSPADSKDPAGAGKARPQGKGTPTNADTKSSVNVAVRVRPLTEYEIGQGAWNTMDIVDKKLITIHDPREKGAKEPIVRSREAQFVFDCVFEQQSKTREMYETTVKPLVGKVMEGFHGTVFAYGATGSGKTYTMSGTKENPGIIYFTISDLFQVIRSREYPVRVTASYLEIYNETLRDLLNPDASSIELREDPIKGVSVAGITECKMCSEDDLFQILEQGSMNRTVDSHLLNEASSRSHAILMITVNQYEEKLPPDVGYGTGRYGEEILEGLLTKSSNLTLIDLAGSERAKKVGSKSKKAIREGAQINRSLLALANCINALGSNKKKKGLYIPYRDSKLTRLLKDSLGGGAYCVMIANISSASSQFEETRETLLYANRAKNIKVTPELQQRRAEANRAIQQATYEKIVYDMKKELNDMKESLGIDQALPIDPTSRTQSSPAFSSGTPSSAPSLQNAQASEDKASLSQKISVSPSHRISASSTMKPLPDIAELEQEAPLQQMDDYDINGDVTVRVGFKGSVPSEEFKKVMSQRRFTIVEIHETNKLVQQIVSNFQDRIQIRRSLVELDEMDALNRRDLEHYTKVIDEWCKHGGAAAEDAYASLQPGDRLYFEDRDNNEELENDGDNSEYLNNDNFEDDLELEPGEQRQAKSKSDPQSAIPPNAPLYILRASIERDSLTASIESNAKYRQELLENLQELVAQGIQIRHDIATKKLREERQQILNLTLERCVLELQKMELELQARYIQMEMREKEREIAYYKEILMSHGIQFEPFNQLAVRSSAQSPPLPSVPEFHSQAPSFKTPATTPHNTLQQGVSRPSGPGAVASLSSLFGSNNKAAQALLSAPPKALSDLPEPDSPTEEQKGSGASTRKSSEHSDLPRKVPSASMQALSQLSSSMISQSLASPKSRNSRHNLHSAAQDGSSHEEKGDNSARK